MPRFRKKPVEIEAVQWDGDQFSPGGPVDIEWLRRAMLKPGDPREQVGSIKRAGDMLRIGTLVGDQIVVRVAVPGDWIVREANGDLSFCSPDIFAATYEAVPTEMPPLTLRDIEGWANS